TDATAAENTNYIYMVRPMENGVAAAISNTPNVTTGACGTSSITIDITGIVTDCNASGKARNIIYFTVSGSTSAPSANKGTILNDGNGNYRLRQVNVAFGSVTNYTITVENESVSQSVTAVTSCAKAAEAIASNDANVMVSPNPMLDYATIQLNGFENASVQLISLNGQVVLEMNDVNNLVDVQVSDIQAGVYMLRVMDANNTQVQQVVIK
ncbi:MAG: T9SS type A sorting domain-containing protein, partial [Bacteroidales bacterium]|nr:T9SS type A sorting domain-containing protein [Bacteroidales bacterium]